MSNVPKCPTTWKVRIKELPKQERDIRFETDEKRKHDKQIEMEGVPNWTGPMAAKSTMLPLPKYERSN